MQFGGRDLELLRVEWDIYLHSLDSGIYLFHWAFWLHVCLCTLSLLGPMEFRRSPGTGVENDCEPLGIVLWVLGIEPWSPERAAISPALTLILLCSPTYSLENIFLLWLIYLSEILQASRIQPELMTYHLYLSKIILRSYWWPLQSKWKCISFVTYPKVGEKRTF